MICWQIKSTCAKLRTGWSLDSEVDEADGEAVREDAGINLEELSSTADSLPIDSEAVTEDEWLATAEWCAALFGDAERLAGRPFANLCAASTNDAGWE